MPQLWVRLPLRAARRLLPGADDRVCRILRPRRPGAGGGSRVFELTGYAERDLMGKGRRRGARAVGWGTDRDRSGMGRASARPEAPAPYAVRIEKPVTVDLFPALRRGRWDAGRPDRRLVARLDPGLARAREHLAGLRHECAVPASCLRPSTPSGQASTMQRSPSSGSRVTRPVIRPSTADPRPSALVARRPHSRSTPTRRAPPPRARSSGRHGAAHDRPRDRHGSPGGRPPRERHS